MSTQSAFSDQEHVEFRQFRIKPFSKKEGDNPCLNESGLVHCVDQAKFTLSICCRPSDLLYYSPTTNPTNVDFPHRYFHPPATNGYDVMLGVPKIVLSIPRNAIPGEEMTVSWYFWTSWHQLALLGNPVGSSSHRAIQDLATDFVQTFEPIPDELWEVPILAALPPDFNNLSGPERIKALLKRA